MFAAGGAAFADPVEEEEGGAAEGVDVEGLALFVDAVGVGLIGVREVAEGAVGGELDVEGLAGGWGTLLSSRKSACLGVLGRVCFEDLGAALGEES